MSRTPISEKALRNEIALRGATLVHWTATSWRVCYIRGPSKVFGESVSPRMARSILQEGGNAQAPEQR